MSHCNGNDEDYSSDDSNDEDYVPCEGNLGSEEEDSGDDETLLQDNNDDESSGRKKRKSKASGKRQKTSASRNKKQKVEDEDSGAKSLAVNHVDGNAADCPKSEEESKKKADLLWADFLKDVGGPGSKNKQNEESSDVKETPAKKQEKVTVVKEFNFAGETVRVSSEVDANSKEAKEMKSTPSTSSSSSSSAASNSSTPGMKRPAGGLGSLLDKLQKKPKMSVLEKSKLDWTGFKNEEGIGEELQQHNRGKNGYLEKVAFLQQVDYKQYEIERNLRMSSRKPT